MYYVMYGFARMAEAETFADARATLVRLMRERMAEQSALRRSERYQRELAEAEALTEPPYVIVAVSGWNWISKRPACAGVGDLAYVHEHSNGAMDYTIDVKCKILAITDALRVRVRITGDSLQFQPGEEVTIPASFIRTRTYQR